MGLDLAQEAMREGVRKEGSGPSPERSPVPSHVPHVVSKASV